MSEFHASRIAHQAIYRQTTSYTIPKISHQAAYAPVGGARFADISVQFLRTVASPIRIHDVSVQYLRSARLKDMTKPLFVTRVQSQAIYQVVVAAQLFDTVVLIMQNKTDRIVADAPGGLFQTRIY